MNVQKYVHSDRSELEFINPIVREMLGDVNRRSVVDYGCGGGLFLEELTKLGAITYGYDISALMIEKAKERLGNNTQLKVIESGNIPLPDNSIDAVVSNFVLMMCPNKGMIRDVLIDIYRILRLNGKFLFCITHPCFIDKSFSTYRNIFTGDFDYFYEGQGHQFSLINRDGKMVTDESFRDYHYPLETYLNFLTETGFILDKLKEVKLKENKYPPYLIVSSTK